MTKQRLLRFCVRNLLKLSECNFYKVLIVMCVKDKEIF